ncbi:BnaC07g33590D [Brassica napus]|uniref:Cysteine proteinase inhibitor n=2 Tax=Brassica napus TaxID=3708 RepID=A0A078F9F6_BRANA|nr:BnaC07g33590D [Brassica napus]
MYLYDLILVLILLPDAMLIMDSRSLLNLICLIVFVSVSVGMGLLAGSTVMLLSIIWRTCTVLGKCNIRDTIAVNNQDTRSFHLKVVEFVWVVSAKEKFVAETLKHLTMEIIGARRKKLYEATVWVKPRMNFKELCR